MSNQISSISSSSTTSTTSSSSSSSSSSASKLTEETKRKLEALGVDTTNITTETQGQIALLQAQQQQAQQNPEGGNKAEMESIKSQATALAGKLGVSVSSDEKVPDIMSAIGSALNAKVSAAGNDQAKIAEVQELQAEYDSISSSLSNMQTQQAQRAQAISSNLTNLANQNKIYHQV